MLSAGPYGFVAQHRCNVRHAIANQDHVNLVTNARERLRETRRWLPLRASGRSRWKPAHVSGAFLHGVASGDPLADAIVLWTHVTAEQPRVPVDWVLARDSALADVVASGEA